MELGKQIKKYRMEANLSQEELADKVFVSRQTISNWENDKNYPDINSLVLMSEVFHVSLDHLVKGDLERMKKEIDKQEYAEFQKDSTIFSVLFVALLIVPVPLVMLFKWFGMVLYLGLFAIGMYFAIKIEKYKKKYDIQTYKEIVAFTEGKSLSEIEKAREEGKRPYQKALLPVASAALVVVIAFIMFAIMK
ncbi:MAG: helix-turn-helix transcriptional regulator [Agathobacter sp.]|nr:helix-turn-helix transcriptional regulator [Agathobacter sp.]